MGAVINATFGSIIEVILYGIALVQGKSVLVEGSIVGSLLAGVLLMPGLSMVSGAIRRKEQKFNARSAGVTSTMLIMAIIGTLTPTLFYEIYGTFQLSCEGCPDSAPGQPWQCSRCSYQHTDPVDDPFFQSTVQYLSYNCAIILVLSYLVGLWFSLRTHASQIWQNDKGPGLPTSAPQSALPPTASSKKPPFESLNKLANSFQQRHPSSSTHRPISTGSAVNTAPSTPRIASRNTTAVLTAEQVSYFQTAIEEMREFQARHEPQAEGTLPPASQALRRAPSHVSHTRETSHPVSNQAAPHGHGAGAHDAPNWSRTKSASVLMGCTVLYAAIAGPSCARGFVFI
jgi:Ca2+:H+ antiporter